MKPFRSILVPLDFAESSKEALEMAISLVEMAGATLTLVHVCEQPAYVYSGMMLGMADLTAPIKEAARKHLDETLAAVRPRVPDVRGVLRMGVPWSEILEAIAAAGADLVVMGTHGRRGLGHVVLGSVAERIVRTSPVPVLTVRHTETKAAKK